MAGVGKKTGCGQNIDGCMYDLQRLLKIFTEYLRGIKSTFEVDLRRDIFKGGEKDFQLQEGGFVIKGETQF